MNKISAKSRISHVINGVCCKNAGMQKKNDLISLHHTLYAYAIAWFVEWQRTRMIKEKTVLMKGNVTILSKTILHATLFEDCCVIIVWIICYPNLIRNFYTLQRHHCIYFLFLSKENHVAMPCFIWRIFLKKSHVHLLASVSIFGARAPLMVRLNVLKPFY